CARNFRHGSRIQMESGLSDGLSDFIHPPKSRHRPMDSLFDQSSLTALAERLVDAARKAGADAADAVAMRSVSQSVGVRDGAVEESERSEGNDMGLRVLVGRRQ